MKGFVVVTIFLLQITGIYCYGSGAPTSACTTMEPGHYGMTPQTSASPYTITASSTSYSPNQEITVTIFGSQSHGGILVQARKSDDSSTTPIGTFKTPSANTKLLTCIAADSSWTHSAPTGKTSSTVTWVAPASDAGSIVFKATVATNKATYWLNHKSAALTYNTGTSTTDMPETTTDNTRTTTDNIGTTTDNIGTTTDNTGPTINNVDTTTENTGNAETTENEGNEETTTNNSANNSTKSVVSCLLIIMCLLGVCM